MKTREELKNIIDKLQHAGWGDAMTIEDAIDLLDKLQQEARADVWKEAAQIAGPICNSFPYCGGQICKGRNDARNAILVAFDREQSEAGKEKR